MNRNLTLNEDNSEINESMFMHVNHNIYQYINITIKSVYKIARLIFTCFSVIISPFAFGDTNGDQNTTFQS